MKNSLLSSKILLFAMHPVEFFAIAARAHLMGAPFLLPHFIVMLFTHRRPIGLRNPDLIDSRFVPHLLSSSYQLTKIFS